MKEKTEIRTIKEKLIYKENISLLQWFYQDEYQICYYAYDNNKNTYCCVYIANRPTSWEYSVYY